MDVYTRKLQQIRNSAESRGYECTLTKANIKKLLDAQQCEYSSISFGDGHLHRTMERVDNSKGYVPGNVIPVCSLANNIKSNRDLDGLLELEKSLKDDARYINELTRLNISIRKLVSGIKEVHLKLLSATHHVGKASLEKSLVNKQRTLKIQTEERKNIEQLEKERLNKIMLIDSIYKTLKNDEYLGVKYMTVWQRARQLIFK